ncbi:MAG: hypothetical protein ACI31M_00645 [Bacilli bacterium]
MKKLKLRKEAIIVIAIILCLLIALILKIVFFFDKSYEVEYEVDGFNIRENYTDKEKVYTFEITKGNIKHTVYFQEKYLKNQKLVRDMSSLNYNNEECIIIDAPFDVIPLCNNGSIAIDYRLTSEDMKKELGVEEINEEVKEYGNYKFYNTLGYKLLIWDYKNILKIDDNIDKTNILSDSSNSYDFSLAAKINEYILIPDYSSKYSFNKFYVYNILEGSKEEMEIDYDISFDSYILGIYDNSVYLVDNKNKIEYEIVPFKQKIRKVGTPSKKGTILTEKGFEKISLNKLSNEKMSFYHNYYFEYKIEDEILYQVAGNSKTKVSNNKVKDIIRVEEDNVLYIVDDTLYLYNLKFGEVKLASNFDWKFNYKDLMFLYIP